MFKHMVKTITIMDDAYELLKGMKEESESFSDVIRKCALNKTVNLKKWVGILGTEEKRLKEFKATITKLRQEASQDIIIRNKKIKR